MRTSKPLLLAFLFWLFIASLCGQPGPTHSLASAPLPYHLACKLAYIQHLILVNQSAITADMRSFLASDIHLAVTDEKSRVELGKLVHVLRRALAAVDQAVDQKDFFAAGQISGEGTIALANLCAVSRWKECRALANDVMTLNDVLEMSRKLSERGQTMWNSTPVKPRARGAGSESPLRVGSAWNMCGPDCKKTFPVSVAKRSGQNLTFKMPLGTLDAAESQIEIVDLEKRLIRIKPGAAPAKPASPKQ